MTYLDNAATSWPKPPEMVTEISRFYSDVGAAASRGGGARAAEVERTISQCRMELATLVNADSERTVFCFNGTDGLNLAIFGLLSPGQSVVTTSVEHNSVLRPLNHAKNVHGIELSVVATNNGVIDIDDLKKKFASTKRIDLCCISLVSNVTGLVQPVDEIANLCEQNGTFLIVDACQAMGHIPVDFSKLSIDVMVASGHKGLLGPLGTGVIFFSDRAAKRIVPLRLGGTGANSESLDWPRKLPMGLEAGNTNVGGIFGLLASVRYIKDKGIGKIAAHEQKLKNLFIDQFGSDSRIQIYSQPDRQSTGLFSFNVSGHDCLTVASVLDAEFGIQTRAGLHCAPLAHKQLGTDRLGGALRISPGIFNTAEDMVVLIGAIEQIIG